MFPFAQSLGSTSDESVRPTVVRLKGAANWPAASAVDAMRFRLLSLGLSIIEVEQVDTGHRFSFCRTNDGTEMSCGSFKENLGAAVPARSCLPQAYQYAWRCAEAAGLVRGTPGRVGFDG